MPDAALVDGLGAEGGVRAVEAGVAPVALATLIHDGAGIGIAVTAQARVVAIADAAQVHKGRAERDILAVDTRVVAFEETTTIIITRKTKEEEEGVVGT